MNKVFLIGRLSRDPELRHTTSGMPVCQINVAISRAVKKLSQILTALNHMVMTMVTVHPEHVQLSMKTITPDSSVLLRLRRLVSRLKPKTGNVQSLLKLSWRILIEPFILQMNCMMISHQFSKLKVKWKLKNWWMRSAKKL